MNIKSEETSKLIKNIGDIIQQVAKTTLKVMLFVGEAVAEAEARKAAVKYAEEVADIKDQVTEILGNTMDEIIKATNTISGQSKNLYKVEGNLRFLPHWAEIGTINDWAVNQTIKLFRIEDASMMLKCQLVQDMSRDNKYNRRIIVRINHSAVDAIVSHINLKTIDIKVNSIRYIFAAKNDDEAAMQLLKAINRIR